MGIYQNHSVLIKNSLYIQIVHAIFRGMDDTIKDKYRILPSLLVEGDEYYFYNHENAYEYMGKTRSGFHVFCNEAPVCFDDRDLEVMPIYRVADKNTLGAILSSHAYERMGIDLTQCQLGKVF